MYSAVCQIFGYERELAAAYKRIQQLENRALRAERQRDAALDKATEQRYHLYEAETALEEEKGKNLRLMTQINKDFENSSLPLEIIKAYKKLQEVAEEKLNENSCFVAPKVRIHWLRIVNGHVPFGFRVEDEE